MANSNSLDSRPHVLIIGAGITGLLIAQGLKQAGITFEIFDQEPPNCSTSREWTLGIHWAVPFLKTLLPPTILGRLRETYFDPFYEFQSVETVPIYNGKTGELLKELSSPGMIRVSRSRLRALCSEEIPVRYNKVLETITYGPDDKVVTAHFTDGSAFGGDIVIGADGPRSTVREQVVGQELAKSTALDLVSLGTVVRYYDTEKAQHVRSGDPIACFSYSPDGIFAFISVQNVLDPVDPTTWTFQLNASWKRHGDVTPGSADRLSELKKVAQTLAEPFRSAFLWIPEGTPIHSGGTHYWVPIQWDNHCGRVTLAGDAAHPMPPYRGQGLNHCILDASNLVNAIASPRSKEHISELITAYDTETIARGKEEVQLSVVNANMVHDWDRLMESPIMKIGPAKPK